MAFRQPLQQHPIQMPPLRVGHHRRTRQASLKSLLASISHVFWKFISYLRQIPSTTTSLFRHLIALFRDDYQHCSCSSNANLPIEFSMTATTNRIVRRRICKHLRWKALRACIVHIPPLTITTVVLFYNFSSSFFEVIGAPDQNLYFNALQFAAKLHEILIAASLSLVTINYVQYEALVRKGLPLSSVLSGFQVTNLSSIISPQLWYNLFTKGSRARRLPFIVLLLVLVILCAIAGPSAAILILPATGWWNVPPVIWITSLGPLGDHSKSQIFINANESALWPSHITSESFLPPDCAFSNTTIPDQCPAGGISTLESSVYQITPVEVLIISWNITMPTFPKVSGYTQAYERYIAGVSGFSVLELNNTVVNFISWTTATCADKVLAEIPTFGYREYRWHMSLQSGMPPLGPQTLVFCTPNTLSPPNGTSINGATLNGTQLIFPVKGGQSWTTDAGPLFDLWNQSTPIASLWVEPPDFGNETPSIAAAYAVVNPYNSTQLDVVSCSIYASWQATEVYLYPGTDNLFHSPTIDDLIAPIAQGEISSLDVSDTRPIQLDIDWANSALPPNETIGQLIRSIKNSPPSNDETSVFEFGCSLSLLVTDALARFGMDNTISVAVNYDADAMDPEVVGSGIILQNISEVDTGNTTAIYLTGAQYGYGYSTDGITRRLGIGVLLTHVLIVVIHTALIGWYGWSCTDFKSIYDLVVLAIKVPTGLSQMLPPVSKLKKHDVTVKLQEISGSEIELVLGEQVESSSSVEEEAEELLNLTGNTSVSDQRRRAVGDSRT